MSFHRTLIALTTAFVLCLSIPTAFAENTPAPKPATENAAHAATTTEKKVDINVATEEELKKIKGIGAAKAKAIVAHRSESGPFKTVEDLSAVKGFSAKVVAALIKKNPGVIVVHS